MLNISKITVPLKQAGAHVKALGQAAYRRWIIRRRPDDVTKPLLPDIPPPLEHSDRKSLRGSHRYQITPVGHAEKLTPPVDVLELWQSTPVESSPPPYSELPPENISGLIPEPISPTVSRDDPELEEIRELQNDHEQQKLETSLAAGVLVGAVATGATLGVASEIQPEASVSDFDHILQKDTPLDQMVTFFEHNSLAMVDKGSVPLIATNQTMGIKDTLEKTPVRGFDIDLHVRDGEVVINHAGYYNPLVPDSDIPRLDDALNPINEWLDKPGNSDEIVFLNFENKQYLDYGELHSSLGNKLMLPDEYDRMVWQLGRAPHSQ